MSIIYKDLRRDSAFKQDIIDALNNNGDVTGIVRKYARERNGMRPAFIEKVKNGQNEEREYEALWLDEFLRLRLLELGYSEEDVNSPEKCYNIVVRRMYPAKMCTTEFVKGKSRTLRNWNDNGFGAHRADTYDILLRLIFALELNYEDYDAEDRYNENYEDYDDDYDDGEYRDIEDFLQNIGARQLYALDCGDLAMIIALRYNDWARRTPGKEQVTYEEAVETAQEAAKHVITRVEEAVGAAPEEAPDVGDILRELYNDARAEAPRVGEITQFTTAVSDNVKDLVKAGFDEGLSFEEIVKRAVFKNAAAILRSRKTLMSLMMTFFCGTPDVTQPQAEKCIWIESEREVDRLKKCDINEYVKSYNDAHRWMSIWKWFAPFNKETKDDEIIDYIKNQYGAGIIQAVPGSNKATREDIRKKVITDGRASAFRNIFSVSNYSLAKGEVSSLFTRKHLLEFCIETGCITPSEVSNLLSAAGEANLDEKFRSDLPMLACQALLIHDLYGQRAEYWRIREIYNHGNLHSFYYWMESVCKDNN